MTVKRIWLLAALMVLLSSVCVAQAFAADDEGAEKPADPTLPPVASGTTDDPDDPEDGVIPDDPDEEGEGAEAQPTGPLASLAALPFAGLTDAEIARRLRENPASLGSISVGYTNGGAVVNGVAMPDGPYWFIVNAKETWGTQETVDAIVTAISQVNLVYADAPKLYVGDISDRNGGRLNRHVSHQAGRDVDLGFYYTAGMNRWFAPGNEGNLDLPKNWALVRALVVFTDIEMILLDRQIQIALYKYALSIGENKEWLDSVFQYPNGNRSALARHARRHHTHYHVRFYNPQAQEMGRRAYSQLVSMKLLQPVSKGSYHRVRKGETLGGIAKRYGTSISALRRLNGLKGNTIRAGRSIRVPGSRSHSVTRVPGPLALPARRLPPTTPTVLAKVSWNPAASITTAGLVRRDLTVTTNLAGEQVASLAGSRLAHTAPVVDTPKAPEPAAVAPAAPDAIDGAVEAVKDLNPDLAVKPTPKAKGAAKSVRHKVRSGDNLWTIAKRYGVSVNDLKKWNRLQSKQLKPGQTLVVYPKK
jgi:penicillin-insensitive murein endopeptidase